MEHGDELFTADAVVWPQAVGNIVFDGPGLHAAVPFIASWQILCVCLAGEGGPDHGAGDRRLRSKERVGDADHESVFVDVAHRLEEPVAGEHVVKRHGVLADFGEAHVKADGAVWHVEGVAAVSFGADLDAASGVSGDAERVEGVAGVWRNGEGDDGVFGGGSR